MAAVTILYTAQVCTCCAMVCANGDSSGCDYYCEPTGHPHGLMRDLPYPATVMGLPTEQHWAGCGIRDDAIGYCDSDCETTEFSRSRCDGCGTDLAGSRLAVTVLSR